MKSKKLLFILALLAGCFQFLTAQQVYQARHYGEPGDIYLYNRFNPLLLNDEITKSGAGVTWDMGSAAGLNTHANRILEPGEGINQFTFLSVCSLGGFSTGDCFAVWNSTDQAVQLKDTLLLLDFILYDLQRYQAKVSNLLLENFIGFTVDLGGTPTRAVIVYQVPDTIMHFPVAYGDDWTSETRYGLDLNPAGQNIIYNAIQTRVTTIDGWGTLQTPYDTFENVIRLRSDILRLDTIVQDDTDTITIVADQVEYMWLDTNYSLPIMTANGMITADDSVIINQVEYLYEETCPAPTWTVDAGSNVFYLDDTGTVTIDFNVLNANADTYDWDFGDGQLGSSTGSISHVYGSPGEYNAVVVGCMTNCLPLNSCSFQIIDFEILDTTTAVTNIDGRGLGVSINPNPVTDDINLFIPTTLGDQAYSILDMTGQPVQSGVATSGNNTLDATSLSNGMYTMQVRSSVNPGAYVAYMRFMVLKE
jgi:hypothetical protein